MEGELTNDGSQIVGKPSCYPILPCLPELHPGGGSVGCADNKTSRQGRNLPFPLGLAWLLVLPAHALGLKKGRKRGRRDAIKQVTVRVVAGWK